MSDLVLGIDIGTTSLKAGVFDPSGACLSMFAQSYWTQRSGDGRVEQDPADWMRLLDLAITQFESDGLTTRLGSAALTSQVNTHVFVDRFGTPVRPAIVWQDTRASAEGVQLDQRLSEADKIAWLGAPIPIDASHPLARMMWVQQNEPEIWANTAQVLLPKDYVLMKLTGTAVTDPLSNIGLVGLNGAYVPQILDLVPGAAQRLAPIRGITEIAGTMHRLDIPIATATMDGWVGLLGAGASYQGASVYLSGTSEILGVASRHATGTPGIVVFAEAEGLRLHAGPTQSGGASQHWFCDVTGTSMAAMSDHVSHSPRAPHVPLFLPHLAGERAPLWNADLRGAFLGLHAGTRASDLVHAVYEGVALSARHVQTALETSSGHVPDTMSCGGGGFRSDHWGQIRANVLGKTLRRLKVNEPGLVGAACFAAVVLGQAPTLAEAQKAHHQHDRIWDPDPKMRAFYDDLFGLYLEAIQTNEALGKKLTALTP